MSIPVPDMQQGYIDLVRSLMVRGYPLKVRGMSTFEILNTPLLFAPAYTPMLPVGINRGVNLKFAAVEALQVIAGICDPEMLAKASPSYASVLVDKSPQAVSYAAYGPRLADQYWRVARLLARDETTRQAVLTIFNYADLDWEGDRPCTLSLQFFIRNEQLHLITTMRSNDVWLGLTYDVFVFTQLQWTMLHAVNKQRDVQGMPPIGMGVYMHNVGSLHIYERDCPKTGQLKVVEPSKFDDFPIGVTSPAVASLLLDGHADEETAIMNSWYVTQLEKIGIVQQHAKA